MKLLKYIFIEHPFIFSHSKTSMLPSLNVFSPHGNSFPLSPIKPYLNNKIQNLKLLKSESAIFLNPIFQLRVRLYTLCILFHCVVFGSNAFLQKITFTCFFLFFSVTYRIKPFRCCGG